MTYFYFSNLNSNSRSLEMFLKYENLCNTLGLCMKANLEANVRLQSTYTSNDINLFLLKTL